jgi:hypothetical protein
MSEIWENIPKIVKIGVIVGGAAVGIYYWCSRKASYAYSLQRSLNGVGDKELYEFLKEPSTYYSEHIVSRKGYKPVVTEKSDTHIRYTLIDEPLNGKLKFETPIFGEFSTNPYKVHLWWVRDPVARCRMDIYWTIFPKSNLLHETHI